MSSIEGQRGSTERSEEERKGKIESLRGKTRLQIFLGLHLLKALGKPVEIAGSLGANDPKMCGKGIGVWAKGADSDGNVDAFEPGESYARSFRRFLKANPNCDPMDFLGDVEKQAELFREICTFRKRDGLAVPQGF